MTPAAPSQKERILTAARQVFLDGAPESATMDAIAQIAGMSKKTIYREFKSQLELLVVLLAEARADFGATEAPDPDQPLDEQLADLIVRVVSYIMTPRSMALIRLIVSEVRRYPELLKAHKQRGLPAEVVAEWFQHDAVRKRYKIEDPEEAAAMVVGMVVQDAPFKLLLLPTETLPPGELERRARVGVAIFLRGLEPAD